MAETAGDSKSAQAVNFQYRTSTEITTRRGGIFWGTVLLILGFLGLAWSFGIVPFNWGWILPMLVIIAGLYLLVTKLLR